MGEVCPEIERHINNIAQANNTNYGDVSKFWYEQGAKRVVTARSCRWRRSRDSGVHSGGDGDRDVYSWGDVYFVLWEDVCCPIISREEMQTRAPAPIRAGGSMRSWKSPDRGSICRCMRMREGRISLTRKIFCMIEHIPDLLDAGIDSYKIEGRMKTALYVATVARTYRKAIDDYLESPKKYEENMEWYRDQISNCTYRQFTTDFSMGSRIMRARFMIVIHVCEGVYVSGDCWGEKMKKKADMRLSRGISFQLGRD